MIDAFRYLFVLISATYAQHENEELEFQVNLGEATCEESHNYTALHGYSVTDGSLPSENYANGLRCNFNVIPATMSEGQIIKLQFTNFSTEHSHDLVQVYDGLTTLEEDLLGAISGNKTNFVRQLVYFSTGHALLVRFQTDSVSTSTGWEFTYQIINATEASYTRKATECHPSAFLHAGLETEGSISYLADEDYGADVYPNDAWCEWRIQAVDASTGLPYQDLQVHLWIIELDIEPTYDLIKIYDFHSTSRDHVIAQISGNKTDLDRDDFYFVSTGGTLTIAFRSDSSVAFRGFKFGYKFDFELTTLHFAVDHFYTIYVNGESVASGHGWDDDGIISSEIVTLQNITHPIEVIAIEASIDLNSNNSGILMYLEGPHSDPTYTSGRWRCLPADEVIGDDWKFFPHDESDWHFAEEVDEAYDDNQWERMPNFPPEAHWIWLGDEDSVVCRYELECSEIFKDTFGGTFSDGSPIDKTYLSNLHCQYLITRDHLCVGMTNGPFTDCVEDAIKLTFTRFDVSFGDKLSIFDGSDASSISPQISELSGYFADDESLSQLVFYSSRGSMFLLFETDHIYEHSGWEVTYEFIPYADTADSFKNFSYSEQYPGACGSTFHQRYAMTVGSFGDGTRPDEQYEPNQNCLFVLSPDVGDRDPSEFRIELIFTRFDVAPGDEVVIYDGASTTFPMIGEVSGTIPMHRLGEYVFYSTGATMTIHFVSGSTTSVDVAHFGWMATYVLLKSDEFTHAGLTKTSSWTDHEDTCTSEIPLNPWGTCAQFRSNYIVLSVTFQDGTSGHVTYRGIADLWGSQFPMVEYDECSGFFCDNALLESLDTLEPGAELLGWSTFTIPHSSDFYFSREPGDTCSDFHADEPGWGEVEFKFYCDLSMPHSSSRDPVLFEVLHGCDTNGVTAFGCHHLSQLTFFAENVGHSQDDVIPPKIHINNLDGQNVGRTIPSCENTSCYYTECQCVLWLTDPRSNGVYAVSIFVNGTEFNSDINLEVIATNCTNIAENECSDNNRAECYEYSTDNRCGPCLGGYSGYERPCSDALAEGDEADGCLCKAGCSGIKVMNAANHTISDGSDEIHKYAHDLNCVWLIDPPIPDVPELNYILTIEFSRFAVHQSDLVEINDGPDGEIEHQLRGQTRDLETTIFGSSTGYFQVTFSTDVQNNDFGFEFSYYIHPLDCSDMEVSCADFHRDACENGVLDNTCGECLGRYWHHLLYSNTECQETCQEFTTYSERSGTISDGSPAELDFVRGVQCGFVIQPNVTENEQIFLQFERIDLPCPGDRCWDFVEVYDAEYADSYKRITQVSGQYSFEEAQDFDYWSTNGVLFVRLSTSYNPAHDAYGGTGFSAQYSVAVPPTRCLPFISSSTVNKVVNDGTAPDEHYASNLDCIWIIGPSTDQGLQNTIIQITVLRFETEEFRDVLYIYDGPDTWSPELATLSGVIPTDDVITMNTTQSAVTLYFKTNDGISATGWELKFEQIAFSVEPVPQAPMLDYVYPRAPDRAQISLNFLYVEFSTAVVAGDGMISVFEENEDASMGVSQRQSMKASELKLESNQDGNSLSRIPLNPSTVHKADHKYFVRIDGHAFWDRTKTMNFPGIFNEEWPFSTTSEPLVGDLRSRPEESVQATLTLKIESSELDLNDFVYDMKIALGVKEERLFVLSAAETKKDPQLNFCNYDRDEEDDGDVTYTGRTTVNFVVSADDDVMAKSPLVLMQDLLYQLCDTTTALRQGKVTRYVDPAYGMPFDFSGQGESLGERLKYWQIALIVVAAFLGLIVLCFGCYVFCKKRRKQKHGFSRVGEQPGVGGNTFAVEDIELDDD